MVIFVMLIILHAKVSNTVILAIFCRVKRNGSDVKDLQSKVTGMSFFFFANLIMFYVNVDTFVQSEK